MPAYRAPRNRTRSPRQAGPKILFKRAGGWWAVTMPAFPGAFSQGRTKSEAIVNLWDAVQELAKAQKQLEQAKARRVEQARRKTRRAA